jgi:hypothetical protein
MSDAALHSEALQSFALQPGDQGTLLALLPVDNGSSRLAIVGYLLAGADSGPLTAATGPLGIAPDLRSQPAGPAPGGLVVDSAQHRVVVRGHDAGLVFREFELLAFLAANPGQVFTRAQLLNRVWGSVRGTSRTVDVHIHRLRRKLGAELGSRLVTVRRVGYMYQP